MSYILLLLFFGCEHFWNSLLLTRLKAAAVLSEGEKQKHVTAAFQACEW